MDALYDENKEVTTEDEDAKSDITTDVDDVQDEINTRAESEEETKIEYGAEATVDYEALIADDVEALKSEFPELKGITDITDLNNPLRYAALRDLGLSPAEAYMATAKRRTQDTRSHLRSAHGRNAAANIGMMSQYELTTARELFPGMSDSELQRLYKKVTK